MDQSEARANLINVNHGRWRRVYWLAAILLLLVMAGAAAGPIMSRVEQPEYRIEASDGPIDDGSMPYVRIGLG